MKFTMKQAVLALALAGFFTSASATVLNVNSPVSSIDIVATGFGGTQLDFVSTAVSNASYNGTARAAVYRNASGFLDFYYQFSNDISSVNGIERFGLYDFGPKLANPIEVFQATGAFDQFLAGTENSDSADRTSFGVIGFNFVPSGTTKINPGTTSYTQIVRTDAVNYTAGNFGLLDGIGDNAAAFAPTGAVPEPETYALMLSGIGMLGFIGRRRLAKGAANLLDQSASSIQLA